MITKNVKLSPKITENPYRKSQKRVLQPIKSAKEPKFKTFPPKQANIKESQIKMQIHKAKTKSKIRPEKQGWSTPRSR